MMNMLKRMLSIIVREDIVSKIIFVVFLLFLFFPNAALAKQNYWKEKVLISCGKCGGTGWTYISMTCPSCGGRGGFFLDPVLGGVNCWRCNGYGVIPGYRIKCYICNGKGWFEVTRMDIRDSKCIFLSQERLNLFFLDQEIPTFNLYSIGVDAGIDAWIMGVFHAGIKIGSGAVKTNIRKQEYLIETIITEGSAFKIGTYLDWKFVRLWQAENTPTNVTFGLRCGADWLYTKFSGIINTYGDGGKLITSFTELSTDSFYFPVMPYIQIEQYSPSSPSFFNFIIGYNCTKMSNDIYLQISLGRRVYWFGSVKDVER